MSWWKKVRIGLRLVPEIMMSIDYFPMAHRALNKLTSTPPAKLNEEEQYAIRKVRELLDRVWRVIKGLPEAPLDYPGHL